MRRRSAVLVVVLAAALLALVGLLVMTFVSLRASDPGDVAGPPWFAWMDENCENAPFSCAVLAGALVLPIPIIVGVLGLLTWRLLRVSHGFRGDALQNASALVQTAAPVDRIVGRDALCNALKRNLESGDTRLPHVVVGGVGSGKTAVLVRLTRLLARHGAVPVPIRLREAQRPVDFDFGRLARKRFLRMVDSKVFSEAEGDKIWRKLREQGRIVVLADGLEEALSRDEDAAIRDTTIRAALADAKNDNLPLVVTTRPHPTLRYLDSALLPLEPLSEGAALAFIRGRRSATDRKVRLIVENAEVVEAPLYMQLARALDDEGLLRDLDTRSATRLALRVHLLDTWYQELAAGKLEKHVPHTPAERKPALEDLSAIAIAGLLRDTLEVPFGVLDDQNAPGPKPKDVRSSAGIADRLKIVEAHPEGVRFLHSIIQAYLGSRRLGELCDQKLGAVEEAVGRSEGPGRELLMALVMSCWREKSVALRDPVRELLKEAAANRHKDAKAVDLLAAAAEIDGMIDQRKEDWIEAAVKTCWPGTPADEEMEAKLAAIARLGDLARSEGRASGQEQLRSRVQAPPGASAAGPRIDSDALLALRRIAVADEESYAARIAAAQQIGAAGSGVATTFEPDFKEALNVAKDIYLHSTASLSSELRRRFSLQGWTLPMIAGSKHLTEMKDQQSLRSLIGEWIDLACRNEGVDPSIEEAWARGFKFEANRKPGQVNLEMRSFLAEEAERLLESCKFWFTRVTLFHAFTLWGLDPGDDEEAATGNGSSRESRRLRRQSRDRARRIVEGWNTDRKHPFVAETALLCQEALHTGLPGRYIWIDETGTLSKLGVGRSRPHDIPSTRLWISPAAGWMSLDARAFKLVGDLSVALNLAEGGESSRREQRLAKLGRASELPPCLAQRSGRDALRVLGGTDGFGPRPGSTCLPGCFAHLCPYPPPGRPPLRGELSEAFCREQANAIDRALPGIRRRDGVPSGELKAFWRSMERRAQL